MLRKDGHGKVTCRQDWWRAVRYIAAKVDGAGNGAVFYRFEMSEFGDVDTS